MNNKNALVRLIAVSLASALAACGGGGGGDEAVGLGTVSLSAQAESATSIRLSWSAPGNGVSYSSYSVARNDSGSSSVVGSTQSRTFTVAGLAPQTQYCFQIRAPITANVISNTACATTSQDTSPPTSPAGFTATAVSPAQVDLSWQASSDDTGITRYEVYRDGVLVTTQTAITFSDTGATPGVQQCYIVVAVDFGGNSSSPSAEQCVTPPADVQNPTQPTEMFASFVTDGAPGRIVVEWMASTDDAAIAGYEVRRDGVLIDTVAALSFSDGNVQPDTPYCYTVTAIDIVGKPSVASIEACARASWRAVAIDNEQPRSVSIEADSTSAPHVFYKTLEFDSGAGGFLYRLRYIRPPLGEFANSEVLEEGENTFALNDAFRLTTAIDSSDRFLAIHKFNPPVLPESVRLVTVNGFQVARESIVDTTDDLRDAAVAADSTGAVHACFVLGTTLFYATNESGSWVQTDADTLVAGVSGRDCDIAVDANDAIHIAYIEPTTRRLAYLSDAGGAWNNTIIDTPPLNVPSTATSVSLALDATGNAHIAFINDIQASGVEYASNASGAWLVETVDNSANLRVDCELVLDDTGVAHVVYRESTGGNRIRYATNPGGNWSAGVLYSSAVTPVAIAVDSLGDRHVVFEGLRQRLLYVTTAP